MDLRIDLEEVEAELSEAQAQQARLEARIEGLVAHRDALTRRLELADAAASSKVVAPKTLTNMYKRPAILTILRQAEKPLTASEITERLRDAGRTNERVNTVQLYLTALYQDEEVVRPKRGLYALAPARKPKHED